MPFSLWQIVGDSDHLALLRVFMSYALFLVRYALRRMPYFLWQIVGDSDHLTLLRVLTSWQHAGCRSSWAAANFLHAGSLLKALEVRA
jgi:hypothetical protein